MADKIDLEDSNPQKKLLHSIQQYFLNISLPHESNYSELQHPLSPHRINLQQVLGALYHVLGWHEEIRVEDLNMEHKLQKILQQSVIFAKAYSLLLNLRSHYTSETDKHTISLEHPYELIMMAMSAPWSCKSWYPLSHGICPSVLNEVLNLSIHSNGGNVNAHGYNMFMGLKVIPLFDPQNPDPYDIFRINNPVLYEGVIFPIPVTSPQMHALALGK
ncbi:MAG: hypothetical protein ACOCXT_04135 [Candidatus Dojkabacteria bacterium]